MLQVRNLPDDIHARLKERAARERMSLSDYVARELAKLVRYRDNNDLVTEARSRGPALTGDEIVAAVRADRDDQ